MLRITRLLCRDGCSGSLGPRLSVHSLFPPAFTAIFISFFGPFLTACRRCYQYFPSSPLGFYFPAQGLALPSQATTSVPFFALLPRHIILPEDFISFISPDDKFVILNLSISALLILYGTSRTSPLRWCRLEIFTYRGPQDERHPLPTSHLPVPSLTLCLNMLKYASNYPRNLHG